MDISIIIPVYNVEKYLGSCINSIIGHNNMSDTEILLIDDGSTDTSGRICDKFSKKFNFIKTIHQRNMGLSAARNKGLKLAKGNWIVFVDSDDLTTSNYIPMIKEMIKLSQFDIFIFRHFNFSKIEDVKLKSENGLKITDISKDRAMQSLSNNAYGSYAWNKVYKKKLFDNITYPLNKTYEDMFTTYKLYDRAHKIAVCNEILYLYRQREGSIVYETKISKKIELYQDRYLATSNLYHFFEIKYPKWAENSKKGLIECALVLVTYVDVYNFSRNTVYKNAQRLLLESSIKDAKSGNKILLMLYKCNRKLYVKLIHKVLIWKNKRKK